MLLDDSDPVRAVPIVLDLLDGLLVPVSPSEPEQIFMGQSIVSEGGEFYDMVRLGQFWVEDGTLISTRSRNSFAAGNMRLFRREEYTMDSWARRLTADGTLVPEPAATPCPGPVPEATRPCAEGEQDMLPLLAPMATERIGPGESFISNDAYPFEASIEESTTDGIATDLVVVTDDGRLEAPIFLGEQSTVLTKAPMLEWDGAVVVVASDDADQPADLAVHVQHGDQLMGLGEPGPAPLGRGTMPNGRPFRSWLTVNGALFTIVAESTDESGPWQVYTGP
ncbi:hypothetical protein [Nocardioides sp. B-3]|uniref:hypothetical protein n=1 Tax=Nocardioides sp. B-3 TaxID=2895565 RepID=UPI0021536F21|nr:hypothetical protein [Nocardioides sp. B-3]UUZ58316.1 hypothetical protein LP418_19130 [Nocardioides sp. B-3]